MTHCQYIIMEHDLFIFKEPIPELKEPHAITILRPWVNVGRVGTSVISRLERYLEVRQLATLRSPGKFFDFTRYRPRTRIVTGKRETIVPNSTISYTHSNVHSDLLLLNLREPHAFAEDYIESILDIFKRFKVKRYCMIGAMYDIVPHTRPLLVTGLATGKNTAKDVQNLGLEESGYQGPTSILSVISQKARKMGIETLNLIVHLPQYLQVDEDLAGTSKIMEILCSIYGLPPHLIQQEKGESQYGEFDAAVEASPEFKSVLQQLEERYDARHGSGKISDVYLSPEIENFLKELTQKRENDS